MVRALVEVILREVSAGTLSSDVAERLILQSLNAGASGPVVAASVNEPGSRKIAIVGMQCRFPGAADVDAFWQMLIDGRSAISEIPKDRWAVDDGFYCADEPGKGVSISKFGGFLHDLYDFPADLFRMEARQAGAVDVQQRLWLETTWRALRDAGMLPAASRGRTGIFVGARSVADILNPSPDARGRERVVGTAQNYIAARAAQFVDAKGPAIVLDTACSSSLVSVHLACASLRSHECDVAVAGGVDVLVKRQTYEALTAARALAPDGKCKVFDVAADGYVPGEGAGAVVLKRLEDAVAAGDRIVAVIHGSAVNNDGYVMGATNPSVDGQRSVIVSALRNSGLAPDKIGYVEAHGTGTEIGDPIEIRSLSEAWSEWENQPERVMIGAVKSNIGHLHSAAGIAGVIKAALTVSRGKIPPTLNISQVNPRIGFEQTPLRPATEASEWRPGAERIAAVSAFGFGGTNAHLLLGEPAPLSPTIGEATPEPTAHLIAFSAHSETALAEYRQELADFAARQGGQLPEIADVVARSDAVLPHRFATIVRSEQDLRSALLGAASNRSPAGPSKVFTGRFGGRTEPRLAFVFTGQGSQHVGMGAALYRRSTVFRDAFDEVASLLEPMLSASIVDLVLGPDASEEKLRQTRWTQPALFSLQYALCRYWAAAGIVPAGVVGHSIGELCAAVVAGLLDLKEASELVAIRGEAMQDHCLPGKMAAAMAGEDRVLSLLADAELAQWTGKIGIAAVNTPGNTVVSGEAAAVEAFCRIAQAAEVSTIPLRVSHAFHSPLVEPAAQKVEAAAPGGSRREPRLDFFSTLTGGRLDTLPAKYWADQVRNPVRFSSAVSAMKAEGFSHYLEIGPNDTLCRFVRATLGDRDLLAVASTAGGDDGLETTFSAAAELWATGYPLLPHRLATFAGLALRQVPDYPMNRVSCPPSPSHISLRSPDTHIQPAVDVVAPGTGPADAASRRSPPETVPSSSPNTLSTVFRHDDVVMRDHTVKGVPVLPGVTWLDLARRQLPDRRDGPLQFSNVIFRAPLSCPDSEPVGARVQVDVSGKAAKSSVFIGEDERPPDVTFDIDLAVSTASRTCDLKDLRRRCKKAMPVETFYKRIRDRGIVHSGYYRSVTAVRHGKREVLGELTLSDRALVQSGELALHPALIDAATTLGAALKTKRGVWANGSTETYIPIYIEKVVLHRPLVRRCLCHYVALKNTDDLSTFDMTLIDEDGSVLVTIEGFTSKRIRAERPVWARTGEAQPANVPLGDLVWRQEAPARALRSDHLLVLTPGPVPGLQALGNALAEGANRLTVVQPCPRDDARDRHGLRRILANLSKAGSGPNMIVLLCDGLQFPADDSGSTTPLFAEESASAELLLDVHKIAQELAPGAALRVAYGVGGEAEAGFIPRPGVGVIAGLFRALVQERPNTDMRLIAAHFGAASPKLLASEILSQRPQTWTGVSSSGVFAPALVDIAAPPSPAGGLQRLGSHVLITGGLGGLGQLLAERLLAGAACRLTLVQRSGEKETPLAAALKAELDNRLTIQRADVTDAGSLERALNAGRASAGPITAIIHAAGRVDDALGANLEPAALRQCLAVKLKGAELLERMTLSDPLEAFVIYSSTAAFRPALGQAAYAAAASAVDAFVFHRNASGKPGRATTLNWTMWHGRGMAADPRVQKRFVESGGKALSDRQALGALDLALGARVERAIVDTVPRERALDLTAGSRSLWQPKDAVAPALRRPAAPRELILEIIAAKLGRLAQDIDPGVEFLSLGLDSGDLIDVADEIGKAVGRTIHPTALFEHISVNKLARFIGPASVERTIPGLELSGAPLSDDSMDRAIESPDAAHLRTGDQFTAAETLRFTPFEPLAKTQTFQKQAPQKQPAGNPAEFIARANVVPRRHRPSVGRDDIAVIGFHGRFPGCDDPEALWKLIRSGGVAVGPIPAARWRPEQHRGGLTDPDQIAATGFAGLLTDVDAFDPGFFRITPREAELIDPQQRVFLEVCWEALRDAGFTGSALEGSNTGVYVGVMNSDYLAEAARQGVSLGVGSGVSNAILANRVSFAFDLRGTSMPVETACSSGLFALHHACLALRNDECEQAIVGAVNLTLSPRAYADFSGFGMLSPTGRCKTFSAEADGYVRGEGAVALILKRAQDALRDGDTIHGLVRGSATGHNGRTNGISAPSPSAQADVITRALADAGFGAETVSYVEAHGTGTPLGDPVEVAGLTRSFSKHPVEMESCPIGALKANIGHLEAASGLAGVVKVLLAFRYGELPPLVSYGADNPDLGLAGSPFRLCHELEKWHARPGVPRRAGVSAFGFGGANAHVLLEEWISSAAPGRNDPHYPLACSVSAHSQTALRTLVANLRQQEAELADHDIASFIRAIADGPVLPRIGFAFVVESRAHLRGQLAGIAAVLEREAPLPAGVQSWKDRQEKNLVLDFGTLDQRLFAHLAATAPFMSGVKIWAKRLKKGGFQSDLSDGKALRDDPASRVAAACVIAESLKAAGCGPLAAKGEGLGQLAADYISGALKWKGLLKAARDGSVPSGEGRGEPESASGDDLVLSLAADAASGAGVVAFAGGLYNAQAPHAAADLICRLYAAGAPLRLVSLWHGPLPPRLRLKPYPFDRQRFSALNADAAVVPSGPKTSRFRVRRPVWTDIETAEAAPRGATLIILNATDGPATSLSKQLLPHWKRVITSLEGNAGADGGNEVICAASLRHALTPAMQAGAIDILDLGGRKAGELDYLRELPKVLAGLHALGPDSGVRYLYAPLPEDPERTTSGRAEFAASAAFLRCAAQEQPLVKLGALDLGISPSDSSTLATGIVRTFDFALDGATQPARFSGRRLLTARMMPEELAETPSGRLEGQVWWVLGGTGGLGRATVSHLQARGAGVVISSRIAPADPASTHVPCDVAEFASVEAAAEAILAERSRIDGIVHAAGVSGRGRAARDLTSSDFDPILSAKVAGSANLDRIARRVGASKLIFYSSASASYGGLHFADYAAASAFQTAYAGLQDGLSVHVVEWGAWAGGGMADDATEVAELALSASPRLTPPTAMEAFDAVLSRPDLLHCLIEAAADPAQSKELAPLAVRDKARNAHASSRTTASAPKGELGLIRRAIEEALLLDAANIPESQPLWDLGVDSRTLIEILQRYEAASGLTAPLDAVLQDPTIAGILSSSRREVGADE